MSVHEQLGRVQARIKAPKGFENQFGGFFYRTKAQVFEAAKGPCAEEGLTLTVTDEMVVHGDRHYVRSVATVTNAEGESVSAAGWAREQRDKKGMDEAQITGAASSYAGKYALANLFCIDDSSEDPDAAGSRAPRLRFPGNVACLSCGTTYRFDSEETYREWVRGANCCKAPNWPEP